MRPSGIGRVDITFLLRALHSRNYRLFFIGQGTSLIGTWMQQVAVSWLVYRLTGSALLLGVTGFASQFPTFLMAPVAGVLVDRWNKQRLFLITQICAMLQSMLLAACVLTGTIQVWQIIVFSAFLGIVNAFDIPVRQSLVVDLVQNKEDLSNAIALNSSMFNGARLIGPSIAGLLVASLGEGICFVINAASYLAVIIAIAAMRITSRAKTGNRKHIFHELREGFGYAYHFTPIRSILALLALTCLMGMPYVVLLPIFAREILHGGAHTFGFLVAAVGIGALSCTLYLASRRTVLGLGRIIAVSAGFFGVAVACFALSNNIYLSLTFLCLAGFSSMAQIASSNTILQTIVDDDKRGRVMSFYTMAFMGTTPLGGLAAGIIAGRIGVRATLVMGGIACLGGGIMFGRLLPSIREKIRPIYRKMGIVPEMALGLQSAMEPGDVSEDQGNEKTDDD
ncbi:MAG: MFS transporter [Desulfuromonadales bacterium]|nr:MFS transporter [Desulfuromonadales bacterium]